MNLAVIKNVARPVLSWGKAHAPEILIGTGIVSGIGATVAGCIATTKTDNVLIEHKGIVDILKTQLERNEMDEAEYKKNLTKQYMKTALKLGGIWAPCVGLTAVSATSTLAGFGIVKKEWAIASAGLASVSKKFDNYRNEVIIDAGEEKDKFYLSGGATKKAIAKGKEIKQIADKSTYTPVKVADVSANNGYGVFNYLFCEETVDWKKFSEVPGSNLASILAQQELMQIAFESNGYLPLDTVYNALGLDQRILWAEAAEGRHYGWVMRGYASDGIADDIVDFGVYNQTVQNQLFRNCEINEVMLEFNCRLIDEETFRKLARG